MSVGAFIRWGFYPLGLLSVGLFSAGLLSVGLLSAGLLSAPSLVGNVRAGWGMCAVDGECARGMGNVRAG